MPPTFSTLRKFLVTCILLAAKINNLISNCCPIRTSCTHKIALLTIVLSWRGRRQKWVLNRRSDCEYLVRKVYPQPTHRKACCFESRVEIKCISRKWRAKVCSFQLAHNCVRKSLSGHLEKFPAGTDLMHIKKFLYIKRILNSNYFQIASIEREKSGKHICACHWEERTLYHWCDPGDDT